jgi:hypothetical protein
MPRIGMETSGTLARLKEYEDGEVAMPGRGRGVDGAPRHVMWANPVTDEFISPGISG